MRQVHIRKVLMRKLLTRKDPTRKVLNAAAPGAVLSIEGQAP